MKSPIERMRDGFSRFRARQEEKQRQEYERTVRIAGGDISEEDVNGFRLLLASRTILGMSVIAGTNPPSNLNMTPTDQLLGASAGLKILAAMTEEDIKTQMVQQAEKRLQKTRDKKFKR